VVDLKKTFSLLLALLLCFSLPISALGAELGNPEEGITPRYSYIAVLSWSFDIDKSGIGEVSADMSVHGWYDCEIKADIHIREDGVWTSYKKFSVTDTDGEAGKTWHWALKSGYVYRCRFTFVVYDEDGKIIEDVTKYSDEVYCNSSHT